MEQRISLITLGVRDLAAATAFYGALGWVGREIESTVFFPTGGPVVTLWSRAALAADAGLEDRDTLGPAFGGIALAHNVRSDAEVDRIVTTARAAGATVTREPAPTFYGGYAGYFCDPDGHLWEIAHNPGFALRADGTIALPAELGGDEALGDEPGP